MQDSSFFERIAGIYNRWYDKTVSWWEYCSQGVWEDRRNTAYVKFIKIVNITVKTFLDKDLQSQACALTYRTLLAIVPALALLFAIGRGFGFQNILQSQLYSYFPSQHKALEIAFSFVDSCLSQASEGVFVGVGILFLLYTIITLLESVEISFNNVWGVNVDRSFFRKVTDYLAICIILPILMICSGGLQIFMSSAIQRLLPYDFISPLLEFSLDVVSFVLGWLFFTGAYILIPNTRVRFKNAFSSGIIAGTAFQILQWLFVSGQVFVSKYNAIYGSFSFLPLMLIWMQFSWLITLAGALICSASQNIDTFNYNKQIANISENYKMRVYLGILSFILKRFRDGETPLNPLEISKTLNIPLSLSKSVIKRLIECNLIERVMPKDLHEPIDLPVGPCQAINHYTVGYVTNVLWSYGDSGFISGFEKKFPGIVELCDDIDKQLSSSKATTLLISI